MTCRFPGCGHGVFTAGLCHGHYAQRRRGQDLRVLKVQKHGLVSYVIRLRRETIDQLTAISETREGRTVARRILEAATGTADT